MAWGSEEPREEGAIGVVVLGGIVARCGFFTVGIRIPW